MQRPGHLSASVSPWMIAALLGLSTGKFTGNAATPYTEATVTRVQNKVSYGEQQGGQSVTRPAASQDVVRARNFLLSESDSRAELQYPDGTIVRIGQNTVFSFEAESRTLNLTKGTFIFYVPKGQSGATIKTPSLTAAITGTVGFAAADGTTDKIGFLDGAGKVIPSGEPVLANRFASRTANGPITVNTMSGAGTTGALWTFNGPLPPFREALATAGLAPDLSILSTQETLDRTANHPGALGNFFPVTTKDQSKEDKSKVFIAPTPTPRPTPEPRQPRRPYDSSGSSGGSIEIIDFGAVEGQR